MNVRITVSVHGLVQGVAFRYYACRRAQELGCLGRVWNMPDGTVQGVFEGEEAAVRSLVEWCRSGPPAARVERVDVAIGQYSGEYTDFTSY